MKDFLVWSTIAAGLVIVAGVVALTTMYIYYVVKKDKAVAKARKEAAMREVTEE